MKGTVLTMDPGLRTGLALYTIGNPASFESYILDPDDTIRFLLDQGRIIRRDADDGHIVVEKFTVSQRTARSGAAALNWPWELTGVARAAALVNGLNFDTTQGPDAAKRFATDDRLKERGLYTGGTEDHARDAARHLLLWLARRRLMPPLAAP